VAPIRIESANVFMCLTRGIVWESIRAVSNLTNQRGLIDSAYRKPVKIRQARVKQIVDVSPNPSPGHRYCALSCWAGILIMARSGTLSGNRCDSDPRRASARAIA
jgi:hypothetical protein